MDGLLVFPAVYEYWRRAWLAKACGLLDFQFWYNDSMANQQLIDYINQQIKLGVEKGTIKNMLVSAGWAETDVNEALNAKPEAVSSGSSSVSTSPVSAVSSPAATRDVVAPFSLQQKSSPVETAAKPKLSNDVTIKIDKSTDFKDTPVTKGKGSPRDLILIIVMGVIIVGLLAAGVILYKINDDLGTQAVSLKSENDTLSANFASIQKNVNDLNGQNGDLKTQNGDLNSQLSLFVLPPGSTSTSGQITLKGTLGGGAGRALYTLTTSKGITVTIKNSKSPKVDPILKTYLGTVVELTGTYTVGTKEMTASEINGQASEVPAAAAQPAPAQSASTTNASTSAASTSNPMP